MRAIPRVIMPALAGLLLTAACASEEPAVQNSEIDEGGLYEDGALEQVQPVEPGVQPEMGPEPVVVDSAVAAPRVVAP